MMGVVAPWRWLLALCLSLLFLVPAGETVRSKDATFPRAVDNFKVQQGDSAILRCTVDSREARLLWLNSSSLLYTDNYKWSADPRVVLVANTKSQYSVKIQNVDIYDEGLYTCSVLIDNHFKITQVRLIVQGVLVQSEDAGFPSAIYNLTVRQGDSAILRHTVDSREVSVAWLNRSSILYSGNDKWSIDPRVVLVANTKTQYSVKIQNVDIYDEGLYTCSVQTGNDSKITKVRLIVQVPPEILNISTDITVNEGSTVTLRCLATGRPEPAVTWKHYSETFAASVSDDEYLEITGITREQSGLYECSAANEVAAPAVRRVSVTVNYPPYISDTRNTGASVGQKGTLRCSALAVPLAEIQWYKEDTRLSNGLDGVRIENKDHLSILTFFNVSEKDYGNYTCVASNKLGNSNASVILYDIPN